MVLENKADLVIVRVIDLDTLACTCPGCPSQWEAKTKDGKDILVHLRHGIFKIYIDEILAYANHPEGFDGIMSTIQMLNYLDTIREFGYE